MTLDEAKARFEEWRNNRSGKARIPAELWSAAVEVARREGIKLVAPQTQSVPECTLEVEGRRGKLRIQLKGASASDLATLSRALCEASS
ncbi:MAG: hypothetical protein ABUS49_09495 [Acidobacteriota bacterium]